MIVLLAHKCGKTIKVEADLVRTNFLTKMTNLRCSGCKSMITTAEYSTAKPEGEDDEEMGAGDDETEEYDDGYDEE